MPDSRIPLYLITGFLDAGKTQFINGALEDGLAATDRTLLLCCEEGEEEYDPLQMRNVTVVNVEDEEELTKAFLKECEKKHRPRQVVVEYNGMWSLDTLWLSFFSPFAMLGGAGCFASARAFLPRLRLGERAGRVLLELSQCAFGVYLLHPMLGELFAPWMEPLGWTWLTIPLRALAVYGAALGLVWLARRFWSMAVRRIRRASGRA